MTKTNSLVILFFLSFNLFFFGPKADDELTWTKEAAIMAEDVASIYCSGHGKAFVDGIKGPDGRPVCECNTCYSGPNCSEFLSHCQANAESADALFWVPFWEQHAASSAVVVAGWDRMSYVRSDKTTISAELVKQIKELHTIVGNANVTGKFIVFGCGCLQLLNAAVNALSANRSSSAPARVVALAPYYYIFRPQTELFESKNFTWGGDAAQWTNISDPSQNFIEFVTSPSNPEGRLEHAVLNSSSVTLHTIHDLVYYWPHYTPIPNMVDEDIMLFSLSKLTGHAGSRFGWALIKDRNVYDRMSNYLHLNTYGASEDAQLRALKLLEVVLREKGKDFFDFGCDNMLNRWHIVNNTLSNSTRFSLQKLDPEYCTYYKKIKDPSPGLWPNFGGSKLCYHALQSWWSVPFPAIGTDKWRMVLKLVFWEIWLERNRRIFKNKHRGTAAIVMRNKIATAIQISHSSPHKSFQSSYIMAN